DLGRIDVLAAGDVHVLPAVDDVEETVRVDARGVTRVQPAVSEGGLVGVGPVPVTGRDVWSLGPELAELTDIGVRPIGPYDAHFLMQHGLAGRARLARGILAVEHQHRGRGLGHAVTLLESDATAFPDLEQRHRHRRAADTANNEPAEIGLLEIRML